MPSHIVRVLCEARSQSRSVRDAATGEVPFFWRGSSVVIQLGLADNGQHLLEAGVGTIIVEVKALSALSVDDSLMRKEFLAADCDGTFVAADWAGGAKQLLAADFTLAEAAIAAGTYRLIVRHIAPDESEMTYLSAEIRVVDPQAGSEDIDPPPAAWSYLDALPVIRHDVDQALSPEQKAQALENLGITPSGGTDINAVPENSRFVMAGDSLTSGYAGQNGWPFYAADAPSFDGRGAIVNTAVAGRTLTNITSAYAAEVYPHRPVSGERVYLFLMVGTNDLAAGTVPGSESVAAYMARIETYLTTAAADGFTTVLLTNLPITSNTFSPSRPTLNALIRTSTIPYAVIDAVAAVPDPADAAYYQADGTHLKNLGAKVLANYISAKLAEGPCRPVPGLIYERGRVYSQLELTGQLASTADSAMNRGLGDARYAQQGVNTTLTRLTGLSAGSVTVPFFSWGDADSGFYSPDGKAIAYTLDGVQKFRFDSAGGVFSSAGGSSRTLTVFDTAYTFTAGTVDSSTMAFGFGDLLGGSVGRFQRNTSTGLIRFLMQAASSASMQWEIGHASASFRIQAAASQTANVEEWTNSSAVVMAAISSNGGFKPASMADGSAANNTVYYSTTAAKLVYKDAGGTVNALY